MTMAQVTSFGDAVGIVLPENVLQKLDVRAGDQLCLVDTLNGVELISLSRKQVEQLETARQVIAENRESLRELAK